MLRLRTLVGRMAFAQILTTAVMLAAVLGFSLVVMNQLVGRERDRGLMNVASATVSTLSDLEEKAIEEEKRLRRELDEHRPAGVRIEAIDEQGNTVAAAGEGPHLRPAGDDNCTNEEGWRVCERAVGALRILVGRSREDVEGTKGRFLVALAAAATLTLFLGSIVSRVVARRGLAPLAEVSMRLRSLRPGEGERLAVQSGLREIDDFATRFDDLLARVDETLARERRFAAQSSHELRTPLTVLRGELELLAREPGPHRAAAERAFHSAERLVHLVEALLLFGRVEARFPASELELLNLADVVRDERDRLPEALGRRIIARDLPDELWVLGNERLLGRAVSDLVDNALKHAPEGPVEISGARRGQQIVLAIRDHGAGLDPGVEDRIFEPFFRDPGAAAAERPGYGLGLPFARGVARAHGGEVVMARPREGKGTSFELSLPAGGPE